MRKQKNDIKKENLIKSAISLMDGQAKKLEQKKLEFTEKGKEAKIKGLTDQYSIALSGLRMASSMQKRVYAVKLNFELALKTDDLFKISSEFLQGMKFLGEEMLKLTDESGYEEAIGLFGEAEKNVSALYAKTEMYIDEFQTELKQHKNDDN